MNFWIKIYTLNVLSLKTEKYIITKKLLYVLLITADGDFVTYKNLKLLDFVFSAQVVLVQIK